MNESNDDEAHYLVRTRDGLDYARVEPWEGGKPAAESGARRIGGYVVALDEGLCVKQDDTGAPVIVADYRVGPGKITDARRVAVFRTGRACGAINRSLSGRDTYDIELITVPVEFGTEPLRSEYLSGFEQGWRGFRHKRDTASSI